jgi:hypothetical protein
MATGEKNILSRTRILADSARKGNRIEVLSRQNKTITTMWHQKDGWLELKKIAHIIPRYHNSTTNESKLYRQKIIYHK